MGRVIKFTLVVWFVVLAVLMAGCTTTPTTQTLVVPQPKTHVNRPELPVARLLPDADAAQVFKAYEESLLVCIDYAKQLEILNRPTN